MNIDDTRVAGILEELIAEDAAKEMQKSMDFELVCELLIPEGYTRIKIEYGSNKKWVDVMAWVDHNQIANYQEHNGTWLFKHEKDAIMFKLKWL